MKRNPEGEDRRSSIRRKKKGSSEGAICPMSRRPPWRREVATDKRGEEGRVRKEEKATGGVHIISSAAGTGDGVRRYLKVKESRDGKKRALRTLKLRLWSNTFALGGQPARDIKKRDRTPCGSGHKQTRHRKEQDKGGDIREGELEKQP